MLYTILALGISFQVGAQKLRFNVPFAPGSLSDTYLLENGGQVSLDVVMTAELWEMTDWGSQPSKLIDFYECDHGRVEGGLCSSCSWFSISMNDLCEDNRATLIISVSRNFTGVMRTLEVTNVKGGIFYIEQQEHTPKALDVLCDCSRILPGRPTAIRLVGYEPDCFEQYELYRFDDTELRWILSPSIKETTVKYPNLPVLKYKDIDQSGRYMVVFGSFIIRDNIAITTSPFYDGSIICNSEPIEIDKNGGCYTVSFGTPVGAPVDSLKAYFAELYNAGLFPGWNRDMHIELSHIDDVSYSNHTVTVKCGPNLDRDTIDNGTYLFDGNSGNEMVFRQQGNGEIARYKYSAEIIGPELFNVNLHGSQYFVEYQLWKGGEMVASVVGTGDSIEFCNISGYGSYNIKAAYKGNTFDISNGSFLIGPLGISSNTNYVAVQTFTKENEGQSVIDITYHDGLGYPVQKINVGAAASMSGGRHGSIITPIVYDQMRRDDAKVYLPYVDAVNTVEFESDPIVKQQDFYGRLFGSSESLQAIVEKTYDTSHLGRVKDQTNAGRAFRLEGYEKRTMMDYSTNRDSEVLRFYLDSLGGSTILRKQPPYPVGSLLKTTVINEDQSVVESFASVNGLKILQRTYNVTDRGVDTLDTYYLYDLLGRLRWVISPEGSACLANHDSISENDPIAQRFCYIYTYDGMGRIVERKLPGKTVEYMIYDLFDRLVLFQDGNMRSANVWQYNVYDDIDRPILSSLVKQNIDMTRSQLQQKCNQDLKNYSVHIKLSNNLLKPFDGDEFSVVVQLSETKYGAR